jgi:hypothetical protein
VLYLEVQRDGRGITLAQHVTKQLRRHLRELKASGTERVDDLLPDLPGGGGLRIAPTRVRCY